MQYLNLKPQVGVHGTWPPETEVLLHFEVAIKYSASGMILVILHQSCNAIFESEAHGWGSAHWSWSSVTFWSGKLNSNSGMVFKSSYSKL